MIDYLHYEPKGDKKNSEFFEEYKVKIYERRKQHGLDQLIHRMRAVVLQVDTGDAIPYLAELYLMTPYRFKAAYQNETHKIYFLEVKPQYPCFIVLEPLSAEF